VPARSASTLQLWGKVLQALPSSTLVIKGKYFADPDLSAAFAERFVDLALDKTAPGFNFKSKNKLKKRLVLRGHAESHQGHYAQYNDIDIALDCFPYAGTTTTVDSLFMGVPVISLCKGGEESIHAHNVGRSLLSQVGLQDLAVDTEDEYVAKAVELASDEARRLALRQTLRSTVLASPLCNGAQHARALEDAFRGMWRAYVDTK